LSNFSLNTLKQRNPNPYIYVAQNDKAESTLLAFSECYKSSYKAGTGLIEIVHLGGSHKLYLAFIIRNLI
jgi:hypothetical protein